MRLVAGGSSPRWRGRRFLGADGHHGMGLIPALAGTTAISRLTPDLRRAHPRVGGDDFSKLMRGDFDGGSSPRWRGRPHCPERRHHWGGLIPALAGTTQGRSGTRRSCRAHPRVGGDDTSRTVPICPDRGSSPRWRGRRSLRVIGVPFPGLIPALAGTTWRTSTPPRFPRAHPRVGGDDAPTSTPH